MSDTIEIRKFRRFGLLVGGVFAIIAIWPFVFRGDGPRLWAGLIAGVLVVLGLGFPTGLRSVYRIWMWVGHILGDWNTRILLGIVYFVVMTPMGMVMRWFGWDPLDRRLKDRPTYWIERKEHADSRGTMERQF